MGKTLKQYKTEEFTMKLVEHSHTRAVVIEQGNNEITVHRDTAITGNAEQKYNNLVEEFGGEEKNKKTLIHEL